MRQKLLGLRSILTVILAASVAQVQADTITIIPDAPYDSSAVFVSVPSEDSGFGDDANESLGQSFILPNDITVGSILIPYENDGNNQADFSGTVEIFSVADVFATELTAVTSLYSGTFTFPLTEPVNTEVIAQLDLTTPFALPASVGNAGYAIQISESNNADFNPGWEWIRPTDDAFAGGQAYENGDVKNPNAGTGLGERDFSFALLPPSTVPEPSSVVVVGLAGLAAVARRRR